MTLVGILLVQCVAETSGSAVYSQDASTDSYLEYDSSTKITSEIESVENVENVETNFMIFGAICAAVIMFVLAFACGAFFLGCGHLSCGFNINRYEAI